MIGHAGLPPSPPLTLGASVFLSPFGALAVGPVGRMQLAATGDHAALVAAVGLTTVAAGAHAEEATTAMTTKLERFQRATNWTSAKADATLVLLFCVLLTQGTALRLSVPAGASSFSPS